MGVVCTKVATELLEQQQGKEVPAADPPKCHDILFFPDYSGAIGKVYAVNGKKCSVIQLGPDNEDSTFDWDSAKNIETVPALKTMLIRDGEVDGTVTTMFRGSECHGWVTRYDADDNTVYVNFRPDDAFKVVDTTDYDMGEGESKAMNAVKRGHVAGAAERPRVRTADEIAKEKAAVKSYGVAYIHCAGCGTGIWDNPCQCFPTQKRKGYFCQECGKKQASAESSCCGKKISAQAQNQGWARTLGNKYGYL